MCTDLSKKVEGTPTNQCLVDLTMLWLTRQALVIQLKPGEIGCGNATEQTQEAKLEQVQM